MAKAAKKNQTSNGGSSSRKRKNGNAKKGKTEDADVKAQPSDSKTAADLHPSYRVPGPLAVALRMLP